jgi:hypothetical protein
MPIVVNNCRTIPTSVSLTGDDSTFEPARVNGCHHHYTAANYRFRLDPTMHSGVSVNSLVSLKLQAAPDGDTYFLPFEVDCITSMVLPPPLTAAADSFLTANLSGCMIFVDSVQDAPGSIVVYHANNQANSPPPGSSPTLQTPACTAYLNHLYDTARVQLAAAPFGLNLLPRGQVDKPTYNAGAQDETDRKIGQSRTNVEFWGGTIVFGRVRDGNWELFWSTWGAFEYDRPAYAPKGWLGNRHRALFTEGQPSLRVLGSAQFA